MKKWFYEILIAPLASSLYYTVFNPSEDLLSAEIGLEKKEVSRMLLSKDDGGFYHVDAPHLNVQIKTPCPM